MRIQVPAIVRENVGVRLFYVGADRVYHDDARPNAYGVRGEARPIYDTRLTTRTVFDYDFQAARRLTGVAHGAIYTAALGVAFALFVPYVAADLTVKVIDRTLDGLRKVIQAANVPTSWSIRGTFAAIGREIAGK